MKRANMVNEIINNIAEIPEAIGRAMFIKECSELFELPEDILNIELRKAVWKKMNAQKKEHSGEQISDAKAQEQVHIPDFKSISQSEDLKINHIDTVEENIILLILKYGMYEIDAELYENGQIYFDKLRIDQYIFNEFHEQKIQFQNPLFQKIYSEYEVIATVADNQDRIKNYFSSHPDKEISNFSIQNLINEDLEYSDLWESKFEIATRSMNNNIHKLNHAVENSINQFKLRILESYRELITKELSDQCPEDLIPSILTKLNQVNKRREEICKLLGMVITK